MTADQLQKFLDELGQRLTPAASHVWDLAVRQQVIYGAIGWLVVGICVVVAIVTFAIAGWIAATQRDRRKWEEDVSGFAVAGLFLIGLAIFVCFAGAGPMFNPEYAALSDILSKIRP